MLIGDDVTNIDEHTEGDTTVRDNDYTEQQRNSFADAARTARVDAEMSTADVADHFGYKSPSTITFWEKGGTPPVPPTVFELERLYGLDGGSLSRHLGYQPPDADTSDCTVEVALSADPSLTPERRTMLRNLYREFTTSGQ